MILQIAFRIFGLFITIEIDLIFVVLGDILDGQGKGFDLRFV